MKFSVSPDLFARYPNYVVGVVVARRVDNSQAHAQAAEAVLRQAEAWVREHAQAAEPHAYWHTALQASQVDPAAHPPAVERLLARVQRGERIPSVNPAVDLANAVSLRHGVPLGAHDLDAVTGDLAVRLARAGDTFLSYDASEPDQVPVGEPVYADGKDIRTRYWVSRQSRTGRCEAYSQSLFFPIDGFVGVDNTAVRTAMDELASLLQQHLGAVTTSALLGASTPQATLRRYDLVSKVKPGGDAIDELLGRGVVDLIKRDEIEPRLRNGETVKIKLGMDPTGPMLHVGRATRLFKLREFQQLGHTVQLVVGSFTGMLGDPSDKTAHRQQLTPQQVHANMQRYVEQAALVIDVSKAEVNFNADWLSKLTFADVIELAANFTVQQMLEREAFQLRYEASKPIFLHELLYPLLQGQDSVELRSDIELGGTDQLFNMLAGRVLQGRAGQRPQVVMTGPLILGTNGEKMSTSAGNVINMLSSPRDQYFGLMRMHDDLILTYFETCTTTPLAEIRDLAEQLEDGAINPRDAKARLARVMVTQFHSAEAAVAAEQEFEREVRHHDRPVSLPEVQIAATSRRLPDLLRELGMATSGGAAKRLIEQGAVEVDGQRVRDPNSTITPVEGMVLRAGKSNWAKLRVATEARE